MSCMARPSTSLNQDPVKFIGAFVCCISLISNSLYLFPPRHPHLESPVVCQVFCGQKWSDCVFMVVFDLCYNPTPHVCPKETELGGW